LLLFICVGLALSVLILCLSYKLSVQSGDAEKKHPLNAALVHMKLSKEVLR